MKEKENRFRLSSLLFPIGMVIIIFCLPIAPKLIADILDELYIDVEYEGVVTDKWIKEDTAFWIFGHKDRFILEINNDFDEEVDSFEYYNTEIGSYRNWTETELKT